MDDSGNRFYLAQKNKMKTVFDKKTRDGLIDRIHTLSENSNANRGSMNVHQMIKHCIAWEEMVTGKQKLKRVFIGRLFGKIALKSMIGNDSPVKRHLPTMPELKITDGTADIEPDKRKWMALVEENALSPNPKFTHLFSVR